MSKRNLYLKGQTEPYSLARDTVSTCLNIDRVGKNPGFPVKNQPTWVFKGIFGVKFFFELEHSDFTLYIYLHGYALYI